MIKTNKLFKYPNSYISMKKQLILLLTMIIILSGCQSVSVMPDEITTNPDQLDFKIARGAEQGFSRVLVSAHDDAVPTTAHIIGSPTGFVLPNNAGILSISSSSADDTAAGTGARTILIQGLDENYTQIQEQITLNGLSTVNTLNSYIRLNNAIVTTSGTLSSNAGEITIVHPETTISQIFEGEGQDLVALYTVPANHTLFLNSILASAGRNIEIDFEFWARINGVDIISSKITLFENSDDYESYIPSPLPPMTDIYIKAEKIGGRAGVADLIAQFFLVNNTDLANYPNN